MTTEMTLAAACAARKVLSTLTAARRSEALYAMADAMVAATDAILSENEKDLAAAKGNISDTMLDRLALTEARIVSMADGMRKVASLPDPCGRVLSRTERPNGLLIEKVSVPFGVVAMIYESRPNVTSDCAALAIKSGNVCVLRCGKEAHRTSSAIVSALRDALDSLSLPKDLVNLIEDTSRESATALMRAVGQVDLLIPRGGAGLIRSCVENALVPCIQTGTGICHIFVDESADTEQALDILENAKTSRPSVCNACEVCLVHRAIADDFLPRLKARLQEEGAHPPVKLILDPAAATMIDGVKADESSFDTEFLDYTLAVKVVSGVDEAIDHILRHSTKHSEAILTQSSENAALFTAAIDSAAVYVNTSTRFTDGGEFGLGCEIGISTQKLHARGPMGLEELTTYKYIIHGSGQIR